MGVNAASSMNGQEEYIIFAIKDQFLMDVHRTLIHEKIPYVPCIGTWEGTMEFSFMVPVSAFHTLPAVWTVAEECFLMLGKCDARNRRPAWLLFRDQTEEFVGHFVASKDRPDGDYTKCVRTGQFYHIVKKKHNAASRRLSPLTKAQRAYEKVRNSKNLRALPLAV